MLVLGSPWYLVLLALPFLVNRVFPVYDTPRPAVRAPWFDRISHLLGSDGQAVAPTVSARLRRVMMWVIWLLIVLAIARPQLLEPPVTKIVPTRDLLLLVDLSGSMDATDFTDESGETVDRLTAVKGVLDTFLDRREGDRVGLIVFGNAAFVQVPFTTDLETCRILLNETAVRMAGPRTAFGDAIGLGITLFEESQVESRVMIALTDGNDTGSKIPPAEAAKIARDREITIHVVGVGDPSTTGEDELDEEALKETAAVSGGHYYHADDREELAGIYEELDRLDTREVEALSFRPRIDVFHYPLGLLLCLLCLDVGVRLVRRRRAVGGVLS